MASTSGMDLAQRTTRPDAEMKPSRLLGLPTELIVEITKHCAAEDLYCLRQASRFMTRIFSLPRFNEWHDKTKGPWRPGWEVFDVEALSAQQKAAIVRNLIWYCEGCLAACRDGKRAAVERELRRRFWCAGCLKTHAAALFRPSDLAQRMDPWTRLECMGWQGSVGACRDHDDGRAGPQTWAPPSDRQGEPLRWRDLVDKVARGPAPQSQLIWPLRLRGATVCSSPAHSSRRRAVPLRGDAEHTLNHMMPLSERPRVSLTCRRGVNARAWGVDDQLAPEYAVLPPQDPGIEWQVEQAWDMAVVDVSRTSRPGIEALREALCLRLLRESRPGGMLCPERGLKRCLHLGVHEHLVPRLGVEGMCQHMHADRARTVRRPFDRRFRGRRSWFIDRNPTAPCRECGAVPWVGCPACGAVYFWYLHNGRIYLSYRYAWPFVDASSPAWMMLLDQVHGPGRDRFYATERTRNVLWCGQVSPRDRRVVCGTDRRAAWHALVYDECVRAHVATRKMRRPDTTNLGLAAEIVRKHRGFMLEFGRDSVCAVMGRDMVDLSPPPAPPQPPPEVPLHELL